MNIVLIGFMGCGKSSVGRALAKQLGAWHIDTDQELEKREGMSIPDLFAKKGEDYFRQAETDLVRHLARQRGQRQLIISTGGGLPLRAENGEILKKIGPVVWLRAKPQTIADRVGPRLAHRPLVASHGDNLIGRIEELLAQREPVYANLAARVIDTDDFEKSAQVAEKIIEELGMQRA
ncbi:MAG TPA: shikimate kinase [Capsulimonadaceae bacterium]|nr:shikimate kinase [Capsulimonadaceae bacterium]